MKNQLKTIHQFGDKIKVVNSAGIPDTVRGRDGLFIQSYPDVVLVILKGETDCRQFFEHEIINGQSTLVQMILHHGRRSRAEALSAAESQANKD